MKHLLTIGLLSFLTMETIAIVGTSPAQAQCIQADISMQYNISGSKEPTRRTNAVDMQSNEGCSGNVSVTKGVQGNIGGTEPVEQNRTVRHRQQGGNGNPSGVNVPTVQIKTNATADVYNAADKE